MDQFLEEVVVPRKKGIQGLIIALANVIWFVFGIFSFVNLQAILTGFLTSGFSLNMIMPLIASLVLGGLAVLIFLRRDRLKTEYEYTFTNGQMDFAQVFNNKRRKNLGTMNIRNVEACGLVASGSFQRYINMQGIKRTNWFLNREAELLYFFFQKDNQKRIIIIEPSEEMISMIKKSLPQGVWQNN